MSARYEAHRGGAGTVRRVPPDGKRIGNWRLLADEYDHDNWLDEEDEDGLDKVLDAVLVRNARFCPVLLTLVNEPEEEIEAAGVITDCLRFPGNRTAAGLTAACSGMW